MSDPIRCMPPPLSLLCALDDRHHDRKGDRPGITCTIHDTAHAALAFVRWHVGKLTGGRP